MIVGKWRRAPSLTERMDECREKLVARKRRLHAAFLVQGHQEHMQLQEKSVSIATVDEFSR